MSEDILERAKALTSPWRFGSDYGIWDLLPELIAEIESNRALIDQTAENFLKLEPGIAWEGGIDAAMKATVEEVERLRSERDYWRQLFQNIQGDRDLLIERCPDQGAGSRPHRLSQSWIKNRGS